MKATAIRATPFLFWMIVALSPRFIAVGFSPDEPQPVRVVLALMWAFLFLGSCGFLLASGVFLLFNRRQSIIDRMSGTEVIKVYWLFAYLGRNGSGGRVN